MDNKNDVSTKNSEIKFPSFGKVFAEVNKRYNPNDTSINQQSYLAYEYLKEYFNLNKNEFLIIHNVMNYKGKNYLKQLSGKYCHECTFRNPQSPEKCQFDDINLIPKCGQYTIWKSFDDVQITDELACMRKDIGNIYLYIKEEDKIDALISVEDNKTVQCRLWRSALSNVRLATAFEIQEYLEEK